MTSLLMSSLPISISHRLFQSRYSNSRDVVASSPFFSFSHHAARAPRRACSQAITQTTQKKQSEVSKLWLSGYFSSAITELQSTPDNSSLVGKSEKVQVIGRLKQITRSEEISKWMGRNATKYTGMDTEFELEWQKSKDKELTRLFWNKFNVSDFSTRFFFLTCHALITWFKILRVKLYRNDLKGNKNQFELAGVLSYQGFELPRG